MKKFTKLYQLSKTLRFELKPIGKTSNNIEKYGLLTQDEHRAKSYQKVKKIIDRYHKAYIEKALSDFKLQYEDNGNKDSLCEYLLYYKIGTKDDSQKKAFAEIQTKLRKQIATQLKNNEAYKRIDKKELIKEDLLTIAQDDNEKSLIKEFEQFTTYFTGFHENRQNMYSDEEKSTAIAYRLINENLPKFINNMQTFDKVAASAVSDNFAKLYDDFKEYLNVNSIADLFKLDYYSMVLTQSQIDVYNAIIGGRAEKEGQPKIQGLNEYINLYNQQQNDKSTRLPKLKTLFKQILSDRIAISWLPEKFNSDNEMLKSIEECYQDLKKNVFEDKAGEHRSLKSLLLNLKDFDLSNIYICNDNNRKLTDISKQMFDDWGIIQRAIEYYYKENNPQKPRETNEKYEKRIKKKMNVNSFSIDFIDTCLKKSGTTKTIEEYFAALGVKKNETEQKENLFEQIDKAYKEAKELFDNKNLSQDKENNVEKIKNLLDAIKELQWFVKPLLGNGDEPEKDERFYGEFSALWEQLNTITPLYNKVRNYMTRKPYSTEKIKLNFENSTLMDGWDLNKERDNTTIILRKNGLYYLGIINKKFNKIFDIQKLKTDGECYEKMEYKLLPGANKMLPKVFFSKSRIDEFKPSETLLDKYKKETHKKGENFNINDCHALINFFKASINKHEDWKNFDFHFSDTDSYEDLSGFYREVEQQGYKITFRNVSVDYVNQLVDEGKLYLFQIYNKDFSSYSKGTPNMHTLYWKMLFDERNLKDVVYKLNGQAEVFFRKKSISWNDEIMQKGHHSEQLKDKFSYPIIKDRRYTVDKFQFHVPITMNFKSAGTDNINLLVNEYIKESNATHIIGIDRGERHLLYLSLIDMQGNIIKQSSLNKIYNEYNVDGTDYHFLLDKKGDKRDNARKSWQKIESIKELKEGYLSQVIHKIAQLIVEYNAIVVLEDLNFGFKRGRQKVEKQVYQKFEKMLIDKLNYLVDKKLDPNENGGALNALQLTSKFESFQELGKQSGILFYVPAWNTSKMDPTTGFVNLFDTRYENIEKSKSFFSKFESIRYNENKDWFEFEVKNYSLFNPKADDTKQNWTICTYGDRIKTFRNPDKNSEWDNEEINLTAEFKQFFKAYNIDIKGNLKESIISNNEKTFFYNDMKGENKNKPKGILQLFSMILQMRNSYTDTKSKELHLSPKEADYLISPVMNSKGEFYDSRTCGVNLPQNADANGAYNIARKGLWVIEQIKNAEDLKKLKLAISNKEWLQFAQKTNK